MKKNNKNLQFKENVNNQLQEKLVIEKNHLDYLKQLECFSRIDPETYALLHSSTEPCDEDSF